MKVKALIDCKGIGYNFKKDETGIINKKLATKLIDFNYVKEIADEENQETSDSK